MAAPNIKYEFKLDDFEKLKNEFGVPKGELLHVSINPYTGIVFCCYQDSTVSRIYTQRIIKQLFKDKALPEGKKM